MLLVAGTAAGFAAFGRAGTGALVPFGTTEDTALLLAPGVAGRRTGGSGLNQESGISKYCGSAAFAEQPANRKTKIANRTRLIKWRRLSPDRRSECLVLGFIGARKSIEPP